MLSLANAETGRPGFLHHLAGVRKLDKLGGSVYADVCRDQSGEWVGLSDAVTLEEGLGENLTVTLEAPSGECDCVTVWVGITKTITKMITYSFITRSFTMSDSCERFFDIPELVDLLAANLDKKDISRLARTCRRMNRSCTPSLFRSLTVDDNDEFSLFISTPALHTLARNIQHVRTLDAGAQELAYYYNCVLALEEITSPTTGTSAARQPWLPPPDIRTCQIVALPPMTRLSQLTLHLGINVYHPPYSLPSARDSQALLAQLCWVVSLNPGLTLLGVEDITIGSLQDGRLLARTISGMSNIDDLDLGVAYRGDYLELGSYLFHHCPPSIRKLSIAFPGTYDANPVRFEDRLEEEDAECTRRPAPLINLEELTIWGSRFQPSTVGIRSVFDHCPNIKSLDISTCAGRQETIAMAEHIAKACPKIESLSYRLSLFWSHDPLPLRIMDSLPDQQISHLEYNGTFSNSSNNSANISFQRHSTALRQILIDGKTSMSQISISTILKECRNLEILCVPFDGLAGHYTTLTDVLEHPWSCTKLQQLTLALDECKLPMEFGLGPFYARTTPITLSAVETWHFARLENLYRQIGALTDLKVLNLRMVETNEQGHVVPSRRQTAMLMPAMLSLGSVWRRIPGYLHHFSGLKKLTSLLGAVNVGTVEATVTIGWKEAVWMDDHWPELEYAGFFNRGSRVSLPFEWLRDKRNLDGRKELELEDRENDANSDSEFDDGEISTEDDDIDMHD